ncbi:14092_t:CDS:2, partial [Funneliformis geosporum]
MHNNQKSTYLNLFFRNFLHLSNYDDKEKKVSDILNVSVAKLFGEEIVETSSNGKKYRKAFRNNMTVIGQPIITACSKCEYTDSEDLKSTIIFAHDFVRSNCEGQFGTRQGQRCSYQHNSVSLSAGLQRGK